jgi:hypothetical protein
MLHTPQWTCAPHDTSRVHAAERMHRMQSGASDEVSTDEEPVGTWSQHEHAVSMSASRLSSAEPTCMSSVMFSLTSEPNMRPLQEKQTWRTAQLHQLQQSSACVRKPFQTLTSPAHCCRRTSERNGQQRPSSTEQAMPDRQHICTSASQQAATVLHALLQLSNSEAHNAQQKLHLSASVSSSPAWYMVHHSPHDSHGAVDSHHHCKRRNHQLWELWLVPH